MQKREKINQLQRLIPEGLVVDTAWLEAKGYSSALRSHYVEKGWLEQPVRGIYRRPGGKIGWEQYVISMQNLLNLPVIIGGRSALEQNGFSHYVSAQGPREIHLYADNPLPGWVKAVSNDTKFIFHNAKKLFKEKPIARGLTTARWKPESQTFVSDDPIHGELMTLEWGQWNWPLTLSTPERAILELLDEVPKKETFHQADMIMEGLRTLSPRRVQVLLEDCRSVKVKRLFLWFAERHHFRWLLQIDQDRINLGSGKRMLVRNGKLDPKYLITVPEEMDGGQAVL